MRRSVPAITEGALSYQPEAGSMHVLRILLLVMTAGGLAFVLYPAITRRIPRDALLTVIAIACGFSLNLIYLWFAKPGEPSVAIEDKPPVAVEEKAPVVDKANDAGPKPDEVSKEDKANDAGPKPDEVSKEDKADHAVPQTDEVSKEDKADQVGPQTDESSGKRGLTPNCEKELTHTADLLRFFGNRIQTGEEIQSVVADMRQQEKKISEVCPELSDR